jgi:hypothetical protein
MKVVVPGEKYKSVLFRRLLGFTARSAPMGKETGKYCELDLVCGPLLPCRRVLPCSCWFESMGLGRGKRNLLNVTRCIEALLKRGRRGLDLEYGIDDATHVRKV